VFNKLSQIYMNEMLQERINSPNAEATDLFNILLASSMGEAKDENLTGKEIIGRWLLGNLWIH
jgi:hypothetical protein